MKKSVFKLSPFLLLLFVCGCSTSPNLAPAPHDNDEVFEVIDSEEQYYYSMQIRPDLLFEKAVHSVVWLVSNNESNYGAGVITPEGDILTNSHIAKNANKWWVKFFNPEELARMEN